MKTIIDTTYFKAREILKSKKGEELGIDNTPSDPEIIDNINFTLKKLNNIRTGYGNPIYITSGYRCDELNTLVGGVKDSWHKKGLAVDLKWDYDLITYLIQNCSFDKLIRERKGDLLWIHLQFYKDQSKNRQKVLFLNK